MQQATISVNQIITETPYWSLVDLDEDERVFKRFELGSAKFSSRISGQIYCEYDAVRVKEENVQRFLSEQETSYLPSSKLQKELATLWKGRYGRWIQIKKQGKPSLIITQYRRGVQTVEQFKADQPENGQFADSSHQFVNITMPTMVTSTIKNKESET